MQVSWDMSSNKLGYSYRQAMDSWHHYIKINNSEDHGEGKRGVKIALAGPPDSKKGGLLPQNGLRLFIYGSR